MSGTRRKSKHPQKWEDTFSVEELNKLYNSINNVEDEPFKEYPMYASNHDYTYGSSTGGKGVNSEGEMTVLDVLQGSRQGLVAECKVCFIRLTDWASAASHIQSHRLIFIPLCVRDCGNIGTKQSVTCRICQKDCLNLSALAFHVHSSHTMASPPYVCPFCGRSFPSCLLLQNHTDVHDVYLKCPVCSGTYNKIYQLFSHLSLCLSTFHPHLKSLICHVCKHRISINSLAEHMVRHNLQGNEMESVKPASLEYSTHGNHGRVTPQEVNDRTIFLCEICDRRFICFDTFRKHLFDHTDAKMYCPSCLLKGFDRQELVVRHLILRCPRRSQEQMEFGTIISLMGKEKRLNFLQVLRDILHLRPFRDGLLAWAQFPAVHEVLLNAEKFPVDGGGGSNVPTDIDLLAWLTDFEKEMQRQHLEVGKEEKSSTYESARNSPDEFPVIKIAPNLIVDKLDGVVTSLSHRPVAHEIRKNYPGVTLLHDVQLKQLKALYEEATALIDKNDLSSLLEKGHFNSSHFLRLEWEAQYLRAKEPFYCPRPEDCFKYSPFIVPRKEASKNTFAQVDPKVLQRVSEELEELRREKKTSGCHDEAFNNKDKLDALLQEAKGCC